MPLPRLPALLLPLALSACAGSKAVDDSAPPADGGAGGDGGGADGGADGGGADGGADGGGADGGGDGGTDGGSDGGTDGGGTDGGTDGGADGGADGGTDGGGEAPPSLQVEISRGLVSPEDLSLADPGVLLVPNLDDDDRDEEGDFAAADPADTDRATLRLWADGPVDLVLSGDLAQLRVWQDGAILLSASRNSARVEPGKGPLVLELESGTWRAEGRLDLTELSTGDHIPLELRSSPLILNQHTQASELVAAVFFNLWGLDNTAMIEGYEAVLGADFSRVSGAEYQDLWLQDEIEFATAWSDTQVLDTVIDSIRDGQSGPGGGLDDYPEDTFLGPGWSVNTWGRGRFSSQDYFGNLEVSPPTSADGVDYPFGRIYYGLNGSLAPHEDLVAMLEDQALQAPFTLDVSWLCVGHVDEFQSTIPAPGSRLGWKLLYTDTAMAFDIIDGMDPDTLLTRYDRSRSKPWSTAGDMSDDNALRRLNEELEADYLQPNLEILMAELGLTEDDLIRIPGLFEEVTGCGGTTAAAMPGMANLIVATAPDGTPTLFVPDPYMRTDLEDIDADPIAQAFLEAMPLGVDVVFLDDWDTYHLNLGEVHCGSNVVRTPPSDVTWWEDAAHLLWP